MRVRSLLPVLFLASLSGLARSELLHGVQAIQGPAKVTEGYLRTTSIGGKPLVQKLDFWMTPLHTEAAIRSYEVEMTQKLHVVIVSSDFKIFLHVHPQFAPNGHFTITQAFPAPGTYQVYADGLPNNSANHQVFRYELHLGNTSGAPPKPNLKPTPKAVQVGPYEVDLSNLRLHAGRMEMVDIQVLKNNQPAKDLHPYLGAPAHAVFLDESDLSYVHVHPMTMGQMMDMSKPMPEMPDNAPVPSDMMLHLAIHKPGTYRLWLQFRGENQELFIAQFTVFAT